MSGIQRRYFLRLALVTLFVIGFLFLKGGDANVEAESSEVYKNIEIFTEVLRQVEKNYVEPQKAQDLIYGAIKGMVRSLDPHSTFLTKEEHEELMVETKGSFSGIGIEITIKDKVLTVVSPIEGTPAHEAGIQAGDRIVKVDGESTQDMSLIDAVKKIRGPKGSKVDLTVLREGAEKPLEFSIIRSTVTVKSVRYYSLTPEIGLVRLSNFQSDTAADLSSALVELEKDGKLQGLILDLRNNPGGLLSQAIEVSDLFLDSGVIVTTKGRGEGHDIRASAQKNRAKRHYPMIVLVNAGSASAAEIVAGALQDNQRALVLGVRTFGKGSVQTILPLSDGSGLRLTTARYYTPNGTSIQSYGISPDVEIAYVPPERQEKNEGPTFIREEDLKGHMEMEKDPDDKTSPNGDGKASPGEEKVKTMIENDNQLRQALHLLQGWKIFSRIAPGS